MQGLMMDYPLTLQHAFNRATRLFHRKEIVTLTDNGLHRYTYRDWGKRTMQLANALHQAGVGEGDRIATFGWNTYRHLELYFGVPCMGAVLHTLNIRLFDEQLIYIINSTQDQIIFVDGDLVPTLERVADQLATVKQYVIMGDAPDATGKLQPAVDYETFIGGQPEHYEWPQLDENSAAAICYTSGTTGNPKGVVYSHRSAFLHALALGLTDTWALSERDTILPIVPMFHVNAWGLPHSGIMMGSKLVFPGRFLAPASIAHLMEEERVTVAAGVPTICIGVLNVLGKETIDLSALRAIYCGGAAVPQALIEGLAAKGVNVIQAWGMTETAPLGSVCRLPASLDVSDADEQYGYRGRQGVSGPLFEIRARDDEGQFIAWDDAATGELEVRGPWVAASYHGGRGADSFTADGWFKTGDVVRIDARGCIRICDRSKDLVKSGGEWISSVDLENHLMAHPAVAQAAVIAIPDDRWGERPLAVVSLCAGAEASPNELREHLAQDFAKWQLPDRFEFVAAIPCTATGKFKKTELRDQFTSA